MIFPKTTKSGAAKPEDYDSGYYDSADYGYEDERQKGAQQSADGYDRPQAPRGRGAAYSIKLMRPTCYEDGKAIANQILSNNAVTVNFLNMDRDSSDNLVLFLDGVIYAINGHMKRVSDDTWLLAPQSMEIDEEGPATENGTAAQPGEGAAPAYDYGYAPENGAGGQYGG